MMRTTVAFSFVLSLPFAAGCSRTSADTVYRPEAYQGHRRCFIAARATAKQQAIWRLLNALQEGIGETIALRSFVPGVDFRESFEKFYEGAGRLVRWEFNGRPKGNEVPVVLYFDDQTSGPVDPEKERRGNECTSSRAAGSSLRSLASERQQIPGLVNLTIRSVRRSVG